MRTVLVRRDTDVIYDGPVSGFTMDGLEDSAQYVIVVTGQMTWADFVSLYDTSDVHTVIALCNAFKSYTNSRPLCVKMLHDFARLTGHSISVEDARNIVERW